MRKNRVRVLVGTRKGAFILTSDENRQEWDIRGPLFPGWETFHIKGSPADPNRIYAAQFTEWFGQLIQRSDDGGISWKQMEGKFGYEGDVGTHQSFDGSQQPWKFKRVWQLEPSPTDPDLVYAGVEDAAIFRSSDGGQSWQELPGLRSAKGHLWQPGAAGLCLHMSPSRRRAPSAQTTGGKPGCRSTAGCIPPMRFPIQMQKLVIVCTVSPCILPARTCSSCRSTGM
ncbi:MAG: hypothetical protein MUC85_09315 [Anaerolineales bacterium]|nr:hypothetical protein [Anaerolineales bacterium]